MRKLVKLLEVVVGFILSPLTWWNDPVVNIPLAVAGGILCEGVWAGSFPYCFATAYIASNVLGMVMLVHGVEGLAGKYKGGSLRWKLVLSAIYAIAVIVAYFLTVGGLPLPFG